MLGGQFVNGRKFGGKPSGPYKGEFPHEIEAGPKNSVPLSRKRGSGGWKEPSPSPHRQCASYMAHSTLNRATRNVSPIPRWLIGGREEKMRGESEGWTKPLVFTSQWYQIAWEELGKRTHEGTKTWANRGEGKRGFWTTLGSFTSPPGFLT